ncbi:MAG TPA: hypothetical protein VGJ13_01360 [Pseudonocardiaceae bacterium]
MRVSSRYGWEKRTRQPSTAELISGATLVPVGGATLVSVAVRACVAPLGLWLA